MKVDASTKSKKVNFSIETEPGSEVFVAGTFNDWNPTQYQLHESLNSGSYKTILPVPTGRHEYKFVVNGQWRLDPRCAAWQPNDQGTLNSVLSV